MDAKEQQRIEDSVYNKLSRVIEEKYDGQMKMFRYQIWFLGIVWSLSLAIGGFLVF